MLMAIRRAVTVTIPAGTFAIVITFALAFSFSVSFSHFIFVIVMSRFVVSVS